MTAFGEVEHEAYHVLRSFRRDAQREANWRRVNRHSTRNHTIFSGADNLLLKYITDNTNFLEDNFPEEGND